MSSAGKRNRKKTPRDGFVSSSMIPVEFGTDEEHSEEELVVKKRRLEKGRISNVTNRSSRQGSRQSSRLSSRPQSRTNDDGESSESDVEQPKRRGPQLTRGGLTGRTTRSSTAKPIVTLHARSSRNSEGDDSDELAGDAPHESEGSEIVYRQRKKKTVKGRQGRSDSRGKRGRPRHFVDERSSSEPEPATRRSGRERVVKNMRERDMEEEIYADDVVVNNTPKVISIREIYQPIPKESPFRALHNNDCDVCGGSGTSSNKGPSVLVFCQGCSTSIHKVCLGYRSGRDHMVTKIGHENFVMQCRRCIGVATKKDPLAPLLDVCQGCMEKGASCASFSPKRTNKQEEKLREENDGNDPITEVPVILINNPDNVLFRCTSCVRAYHFEHLPALSKSLKASGNVNDLRQERLKEYSQSWQCKECQEAPAKVDALVAWRPMKRESYVEGQTIEDFRDDEKEYLVKWQERSHFKCTWMPGAWVWGVTLVNMRNAFTRRDDGINLLPKWTFEEAVPEEFLRMEIIFDVSYAKGFTPKSESADKAAINMVDEIFVKFQGLGYDDAVWEEPPDPDEKDRWSDFVAAYNEYVVGQYFKNMPTATMNERVDEFRSMNFEKKIELKKQPTALTGGEMMPYQMEGLNWLLYNFHQKKNVILADEMGLGKTIQIISLFASLVKGNPKVCPIPHYFGTFLMSSVLALPCSDSKLDVSKLAPRNQEMGAGTTCCHLLWR
jgi:chromodomain-helicase-DNA-binding protein 4